MNKFIHTVTLDFSNTPGVYTDVVELPRNATRCIGIGPFHSQTMDGTNCNEIEILFNDERNHFSSFLPVAGASGENNSGFIACNIPIIPGAFHRIILIGKGTAKISFLFVNEC